MLNKYYNSRLKIRLRQIKLILEDKYKTVFIVLSVLWAGLIFFALFSIKEYLLKKITQSK